MYDDELITTLQNQRGRVMMTTPVEQIISRGRAVRFRRRAPGVAASLGAAGTAAIVVSVALPAGHPVAGHPVAGHPVASHHASVPRVQLAAWTVTKESGGNIQVSFFGVVRDPAKLQATLRADGVPVSVTYIGQQNSACQPYSTGPSKAFGPYGPKAGPWSSFMHDPQAAYKSPDTFVINPSNLPSGVGLQIGVMPGIPSGGSGTWPYPKGSGHPVVEVTLVKASPQCTGS